MVRRTGLRIAALLVAIALPIAAAAAPADRDGYFTWIDQLWSALRMWVAPPAPPEGRTSAPGAAVAGPLIDPNGLGAGAAAGSPPPAQTEQDAGPDIDPDG